MKRPLFWTVVGFALGEVTYFYTKGITQISIIFIMLICCALLYKKNKKTKILLIYVLMFCIGNIWPYLLGNVKISNNDKMLYENNNYIVKGKYFKNEYSKEINAIGIIDSITDKTCKVKLIESTLDGKIYCGGYFMYIYFEQECNMTIGDTLNISGRVNSFNDSTNQGQFSARNYYEDINVAFFSNDKEISISYCRSYKKSIFQKIYYSIKNTLNKIKKILEKQLSNITDNDTSSLYYGILFGDKNQIEDSRRDLYKAAGIAHILAISGLHISVIGGLIYKWLRNLGVKFVFAGGTSIIIISLYGIMTSNSVATIRAVIMLCYFLITEIVGTNCDTLTSMSIAAAVIISFNSKMICNNGLLLSFSAMFAIVAANYITKSIFVKKTKSKSKIIRKMVSSLIFSMSISLITFPITVSSYYEYSIYSFALNLFVVPLMFYVIISGLASVCISFFSINLAKIVIWPGKTILASFEIISKKILLLPLARLNIGKLYVWQIIVYYMILLALISIFNKQINRKIRELIYKQKRLWLNKKQYKLITFTMLMCLFLLQFLVVFAPSAFNKSSIIFLDVGQGDCILIKNQNGLNIVIDGGSSSVNQISDKVIVPSLKYNKMAHVNYWFVTHLDNDHINGLLQIMEEYFLSGIRIDNIVLASNTMVDEKYNELIMLAKDNKINVLHVDDTYCIKEEGFLIDIIHPKNNYTSEDKNDMSLCVLYKTNKISALFTGDIGIEAMENIVKENENQYTIDVIKLPHHGSKNSLCESFYEKYVTSLGIISCGKNNRYGHPNKEILSLMEEKKIKVFRTDYEGYIQITEK